MAVAEFQAPLNPVTRYLEAHTMTRYYVDCRDIPSESKCSVAISADSKEELLEAAVEHATHTHGEVDTPEFREKLAMQFKEGTPSE
jgi:predicted small metal-binding protein